MPAYVFNKRQQIKESTYVYYGETGIWEVFYNSNGQTRGKKIV